MSRVGKRPISIPSGVSVQISDDAVEVKGPKGRLSEVQKYRIEELKEKGFDVQVMKPC